MYNNAKGGTSERFTLEELGCPQRKIQVICDNITAVRISKNYKTQKIKSNGLKVLLL